ncbi:MAG: extracellular solute-binding protein [Alphaproteobacteria bacterium]|nr:extracellular solute-binding protein [Alphaproteobacteria bacterium]
MQILLVLFFALLAFPAHADAKDTPIAGVQNAHGVALHGAPKYPADFKHLDYVNPNAPKGGEIRTAVIGGFDTLNAYILKGEQAAGLSSIYETLMESTNDEPNSAYGLLAESISYPDDKSYVSFKLRPEAKFNDGTPVTVDDVIWSFNTLKTKGHPFYRAYYHEVAKVEKIGEREVKFTFVKGGNTELPMIMGQLPILPEHDWVKRKFEETTLEKPIGSGPYQIESFEPGRTITYSRVKNYWGANQPINVGRYNFDRIRYDYYRDQTVAHEAFLAGKWDFKLENVAKNWATGYNAPVVNNKLVKKEEIPNQLPQGMQAFAYNLRRPIFQDIKVREALAYAFDFEWSNKSLAFGAYHRTASYYENSELAGHGLPSAEELKILEPYRGRIPDRVFTEEYRPPKTDGSGNNRDNMRKAQELLMQAGWTLKDGMLVNAKGEPFKFEILIDSPMFERWIQPFMRNLEKLGIKVDLRLVDTAQYQNRLQDFTFDMIVQVFPQSISPGNEQLDFWGSSRADVVGSKNICGIKDKVVDELVDKLIRAKGRTELVNITKALDRVLLWNFNVIPQWHTKTYRIAYWDMFGRPAINPPYGLPVTETWWIDDEKLAKLNATGKRAK